MSIEQTQLERMIESIADGYILLNSSYECTYMNRAAERLLGTTRDMLLGSDVRSSFADDAHATLMRHCQQVMDESVSTEFEDFLPALKGWAEIRIFPELAGGVIVNIRDISRRKHVEQRLRVSEERLRLLNENINDYAIMMLDPAGLIVDWNVGSERIFGYRAAEMYGRDASIIFTPEDIARGVPAQELYTALTEGRATDERYHLRRDGTRLWVSGVMTALRDEAGHLRGFAKVARDRTEHVQAEQALRLSEEHLRLALDAAQMGTWDWDIAAERLTWNEQHYHIFGLAPAGTSVALDTFMERVHPEDRPELRQQIESALAKGNDFDLQYRVVWLDGSTRWVATQGRVFRNRAGRAVRLSGVVTDITERKLNEAELRRIRDQLELRVQERTSELEQANAALQAENAERIRSEAARRELLRQLVTAEEQERKRISRELHDQMGQQLTALMLGLQTLKNRSRRAPATQQAVEQLQALVDSLGRDVHQLAQQLRPPSLDDLGLSAALASEADLWSQRTSIAIAFHSSGLDTMRLPAHIETALYRSVLEALANAVKHAQASHISIILERREHLVTAIVEDDGRGFDADAMIASTHRRGLGLLGMQERIAQVGGRLTIESTPGNGATAFIHVPLDQAQGANRHE